MGWYISYLLSTEDSKICEICYLLKIANDGSEVESIKWLEWGDCLLQAGPIDRARENMQFKKVKKEIINGKKRDFAQTCKFYAKIEFFCK